MSLVVFQVACSDTQPGDHVRVVGSCPALGEWLPERGLSLQTSAAAWPAWTSEPTNVGVDVAEYKYVICDREGVASKWEDDRPNRTLQLASLAAPSGPRPRQGGSSQVLRITEAFNSIADADSPPRVIAVGSPKSSPKAPKSPKSPKSPFYDSPSHRSSVGSSFSEALDPIGEDDSPSHRRPVVISADCDEAQGSGNRGRRILGINLSSVHGASIKALDVEERRRAVSSHGTSLDGSQDGLATMIVCQAQAMATVAAGESEDLLHADWPGPDGQDALFFLFDTTDMDEIAKQFLTLDAALREQVASEKTLNRVAAPAKIFGDIHGQLRDMLLLLHHYGFPSANGPTFVFNGDFVDRGRHQIEVLSLIYALKLVHPGKVWLNRGNHEDRAINTHMAEAGFAYACAERFGAEAGGRIFATAAETFDHLPLATLVGNQILVLHGGIGHGEWDLEYLETAQRPLDDAALLVDRTFYNVLWSDPVDESQPQSFGVHGSARDGHASVIVCFGQDVTEAFCQRNRLAMVIRSHQSLPDGDGYEVMHDGRLMRVFSARDYNRGTERNDGSILSIREQASGRLCVRPQVLRSMFKPNRRRSSQSKERCF